jgi:small ligand-binding sensory domain FIST
MRWLAAHATHPDARGAAQLALAPLRSQWGAGAAPTLGIVYFTDRLAPQAQALLLTLQATWPGTCWCGAASVGVHGDGSEYLDEPAVVLAVSDLDPAAFSVFSGLTPLRADPGEGGLLVHADPALPELQELLAELAQRARPARSFGGLAASRTEAAQLAHQLLGGGLSGLRFTAQAGLRMALTQGCQALGPVRRVTAADGPLVLSLDHEAALPLLLGDLGLDPAQPREALPRLRGTLLGVRAAGSPPPLRPGALDDRVRVRHLLGLDLQRQALALGDGVAVGDELVTCQRNAPAALRDLRHMATALRASVEEEGRRVAAALYVSCAGRGGAHFGAPHAEAQTLRHALGDGVPSFGFFAGGEIMDGRLYGYSGVLALFTDTA